MNDNAYEYSDEAPGELWVAEPYYTTTISVPEGNTDKKGSESS